MSSLKVKYISIFIKTFKHMSIISKKYKKVFFLNHLKNAFLTFFFAGIFWYPACEENLHIWFVQKNYISTFLGTFYKTCRYSPTCEFSVLQGSLRFFFLIFLVRHWRSYLFWIPKLTINILFCEPSWVILWKNPAYGRQSISRPMRIVAPMP